MSLLVRVVASKVARRRKDGLTSYFRYESELGGAQDPGQLAKQLTVVFDGASARSVIQARRLDGIALETATILLDAAGVAH